MRHLFIWEFINFNPYPRFHNILLTVCNWFLGCCHFFRENYLIFFFNHTFRLLMVPTTKIQSPNTFTQTQFDYPFSKTELHFPNIALQFPNKNLPPSPLFFLLALQWYYAECRVIYLALILYRYLLLTLRFLNYKSLPGTLWDQAKKCNFQFLLWCAQIH